MVKILHLSDIHLGSGFSHGKINPETGINTRLEDFVNSLRIVIDRAVNEPVDLVLFGGDAFPDATPAPYVHEAFASQFRRLADANIPAILLVGNHDQHSQGSGGASLSIYRTLVVPGFIVGDTIATHRLSTRSGDVQIITLPWLNRSTLLTRPETEGLALSEVNEMLLQKLEPVLEAEIRRLDRNIPTVLLAHLMADRASLGAEKFLAVGKGFTIPMSMLIREEFDYVALGHVHKHQNLNPSNDPPVVYPGSIERVDFGEEKEEKGYILLEVLPSNVEWEFCTLPARPFLTIEIDVSQQEDPLDAVLNAIAEREIEDKVVRLIYKVRSQQLDLINTNAIDKALQTAHSHSIRPELISQLARPRLPELGVGNTLNPIEALATYINNKEDLQDIRKDLIEAAEVLLSQK